MNGHATLGQWPQVLPLLQFFTRPAWSPCLRGIHFFISRLLKFTQTVYACLLAMLLRQLIGSDLVDYKDFQFGILAIQLPKGLSGNGLWSRSFSRSRRPSKKAYCEYEWSELENHRRPRLRPRKKSPGGSTMGRSQGTALSTRSTIQVLALLVLFLGVLWPASAQSTATLQGTVTDPAGAAVPNAKVVASNEATGVQSETVSDSAGAYLFPSLLIGNYKLEIMASGFQRVVLNGLRLDVASTVTQNVLLTLGQTSQTVEVVAVEPLVNTSSNEIGQVINSKT